MCAAAAARIGAVPYSRKTSSILSPADYVNGI
jgi:hypothetical protein